VLLGRGFVQLKRISNNYLLNLCQVLCLTFYAAPLVNCLFKTRCVAGEADGEWLQLTYISTERLK